MSRHLTPPPRTSIKDGDLSTPMEYVDFMTEMGALMQLPRRPTTASMPAIADETFGTARRRATWILPALALALAGGVGVARLMQPAPVRDIPVALRGEWYTTAGGYRDRRIAFSDHAVGIGLREGAAPQLFPVTSVVSSGEGERVRYTITYQQDDAPVVMELLFMGGTNRQVQLSHPPGVTWLSVADSASAARRASDSTAKVGAPGQVPTGLLPRAAPGQPSSASGTGSAAGDTAK